MLLEKEDFENSYMKVSEDFKMEPENAMYLGPNGSGKTTTYNILKSKYPSYGFFSYDDCKEKITKEKKKLRIDIRTVDIEKLKNEKGRLLDELDIKTNGFKLNNISSLAKASEYSDYCKNAYNDEEFAVLNFDDSKIDIIFDYEDNIKKEFLLKNIESISQLCLTGSEIDDIKEKYIIESIQLLEKAIDIEDTVCPVCGHDHNKSILEIYQEKLKHYNDKLNSIIDKYRNFSKKTKYDIENDIKEMILLVKNNKIDKKDFTNYIIIGNNKANKKRILDVQKEIKNINNDIEQLEIERQTFFDNLMNNWDKVTKTLNDIFKGEIRFEINEAEKFITVNLKRDVISYSTGELNYIVFLINILEFEYSNRTNVVLDDPLSSYDIKKQYEIVFDIISRLVQNGKKVIVFTHNINLINISNSQYPNLFKYYFIDLLDDKMQIFNIKIKTNGSIFNIENLLESLQDSDVTKKWLELLIDKDIKWEETSPRHQLFHYDESYIDSETNLSNDDLVAMIDNFEYISKEEFEEISTKKIIYLTASRVWLEKQLVDNYDGKLNGHLLYPKINDYFKHPEHWIRNIGIDKEELTKRKVLLNQNDHYKSQIIPFQYALSISTDELVKDILELKKLFAINE